MKKMQMLAATMIVAITAPAVAQGSHSVRGYTRKDGTYVAPHRATNPNSTKLDNWSTKGNTNPYTGKEGTVDPYGSPSSTTTTKPRSSYEPR